MAHPLEPAGRGPAGVPAAFGEVLRRYRAAAGLTQEALAERAGLSRRGIADLERGARRLPRRVTLERLAEALGLDASQRARFGATAAGPPPLALLPVPLTSFVGREREVAEVRQRLRATRLLTLTGAGGIGKTRLALAVATELLDAFRAGAVFVDLAPLDAPALVVPAIAQALGVREGDRPLAERLEAALRDRELLLVLDNFEHVLAAAPVVAALLRACPRVKVLATSRAPLHLSGEHEFPVAPLAVPDPRRQLPLEWLAQVPAAQLFVRRAQAVRPGFALSPDNAAAVAEICSRLEGLPLAIELAAARTRALPPQALLARLGRALPLLTGGPSDLPDRQRTLRDTIAWSYGLLREPERVLFSQLAVFAGGWTLEAAEAVAGGRGSGGVDPTGPARSHDSSLLAPEAVLDGLESLLDKSLILRAEAAGGEPRFRMLETIREYALEQLAAGGAAPALRRRHAEYFLALAEGAEAATRGAGQAHWLARLEAEHDNFRAALGWAAGRPQAEEPTEAVTDRGHLALRLAGALRWFWAWHGHLSEGRQWLEALLAAAPEAPPAARAKALNGVGWLARFQGEYGPAAAWLEQGAALYREVGDVWETAHSLGIWGIVEQFRGDYARAVPLCEESLELFRTTGDHWGIGSTLMWLGWAAHAHGDYARAERSYRASVAAFRQVGGRFVALARVLNSLGDLAGAQGDRGRAVTFLEESLAVYREVGDTYGVASVLASLGGAAAAGGELGRAEALLAESLGLNRDLANQHGTAECLERLAAIAEARRRPERAARLFGAAAALRDATGAPLVPFGRAAYERDLARVRAHLGETTFAAAWAEGQTMRPQRAIEEALGAVEASPS
jgi:predicted ATPase/DNA-binding XRE family transcriptional regulator